MKKTELKTIKKTPKASIKQKKLTVYNINSKTKKTISVPGFLKTGFNQSLFAKAVRVWNLNHLSNIAKTKTRSERRGGGKKPWRQKGTGRARVGSSRSPLWRKGGIIFGPKSEKASGLKINKQEKIIVEKMILSKLYINNQLFIINKIDVSKPKTKLMIDVLFKIDSQVKDLNLEKSIMIITDKTNKNTRLSSRNIPDLSIKNIENATYMDLAKAQNLVLSEKAFEYYIKKYK